MFRVYFIKRCGWLFFLYKYVYRAVTYQLFFFWCFLNIMHVLYRKFRYSPFLWGPYYRVVWWRSIGVWFKLFYHTHLDYYLFIYNLFRYSCIFQCLNLITFPIVWRTFLPSVLLLELYSFFLGFDIFGCLLWVFLQNILVILHYIWGFLLSLLMWLGVSFFLLLTTLMLPLTSFFSIVFLNTFGKVFCCAVLLRALFLYCSSLGVDKGFRLFTYAFVS